MASSTELSVRPLSMADLDAYLHCTEKVHVTSGVDGAGHSHPYNRSEPFDMAGRREREVTRWSKEIGEPDWRRAWGLFDQAEIVGELSLTGGSVKSGMHRVTMGMGIVESHRRRGGGALLLRAAIAWARGRPDIDWIDLGVFSDNPGAQALYTREGFSVLCRKPDSFRVDGVSLDDISMTLDVAAPRT